MHNHREEEPWWGFREAWVASVARCRAVSDVLFQVIKKRHDKPDVAKGKMIVEILFRTPTATCTYFLRGPLQAVHPTH